MTTTEKKVRKVRYVSAEWKQYSMSQRGIAAAVRIAQSDPRMRVSVDMLDTNGLELNTPSGIVDLTNGKLGPHNSASWHTKITGAGYNPNADCPKWKAFLATTFKGDNQKELVDYMQQLLGYAALGKVTHHVLPFLKGSGENGKSCLLDTASYVFGDYAISAPANFLLAGNNEHPTEIARLQGARFVVCSEINQGSKFDEAKVKLLTGGDMLTGRFMRKDFVNFRPTHTLFLMGNHQPEVNACGHAFFRRLALIEFENKVEEVIEGYAQKMFDEEGPAILAWIVAGAVDVYANGLDTPECVKVATKEYEESEDSIAQFISEDCTRVTNEFKLLSGIVWGHYEKWCKSNGRVAKSSTVFGRDLSAHGVKVARSHGKRYVYGLKLEDTPSDGGGGYMPGAD